MSALMVQQKRGTNQLNLLDSAQNIIINSQPIRMSDDEQDIFPSDDSSISYGFNNLQPVQEEKPIIIKKKAGALNWMKTNDKENKKGKKVANSKKSRRDNQEENRSRSRERSRERVNAKRNFEDTVLRGTGGQAEEEDDKNCIVISDEEEQQKYYMNDIQAMNWRERRKLDRLFEREERKFREGKQKDQLSFKIFNTIQSYFR